MHLCDIDRGSNPPTPITLHTIKHRGSNPQTPLTLQTIKHRGSNSPTPIRLILRRRLQDVQARTRYIIWWQRWTLSSFIKDPAVRVYA